MNNTLQRNKFLDSGIMQEVKLVIRFFTKNFEKMFYSNFVTKKHFRNAKKWFWNVLELS